MRGLCVTVFWTSWALRLTSLSSSFLLVSLLGLFGYQACLGSVFLSSLFSTRTSFENSRA